VTEARNAAGIRRVGAVTHFYFDTENGGLVADSEGVDLTDVVAAQNEAALLMGDLIRERDGELWTTGRLRLVVKDAARRPLFAIETRIEPEPSRLSAAAS
jgi:hypothetical protein